MKNLIFALILWMPLMLDAQTIEDFPVLKGKYLGQNTPSRTPEVFAPGIVSDSTWAEHCQIAISPNGNEIFWSVYTSKYPKIDGTGNTEQLYYSKLENGIWTKPKITDFTSNNKHGGNGGPVFSLDGKKLFFYQRKPRDKYMYYVEKNNGQWSKDPINVEEPYNTKTGDVATNWTPVFTNKGYAYKYNQQKRVILKYKYEGTQFSQPDTMRIHKDFRLSFNVYVAPDESYYIFSGYNYKGFGDLDLYICFKDSDGKWRYPIIMRDEINTESRERFPVVSPDGKYLFFMRHTETQDIFWVSTKIFDKYKRESIEIMKNPPVFNAIILESEELDKYLGVYSCPELTRKITISKEGNSLKAQIADRSTFTIECYDKFKYDRGMLKIEFIPDENKMLIQSGSSIYEMKKQ
jgi:WD40-like Beta Propeller Repeat